MVKISKELAVELLDDERELLAEYTKRRNHRACAAYKKAIAELMQAIGDDDGEKKNT